MLVDGDEIVSLRQLIRNVIILNPLSLQLQLEGVNLLPQPLLCLLEFIHLPVQLGPNVRMRYLSLL